MIVTEKPSAAKRIAAALDTAGKVREEREEEVPYYRISRDDEEMIVVSALGHLYTVAQKAKGWEYPAFNFEWVPSHEVSKDNRGLPFINVIGNLSKGVDRYISACDYDMEGSVIAYTILKYAVGKDAISHAKRMKFSTLTNKELNDAYDNASPQLDFPLIDAGRTRHEVDWLFGINLSRALTLAVKESSGLYKLLSIGRVQGPTLKFLINREIRIRNFVPVPYWAIDANVRIGRKKVPVFYSIMRIPKRSVALKVIEDCKGKEGIVSSIQSRISGIKPPVPFNLGGLQAEAYKLFGYNPKRTLGLAERLYLAALISYPRTSSQKVPPALEPNKILKNLGKQDAYKEQVSELLAKKKLKINEGKKEDPAHPAVIPTGNAPEKPLSGPEAKLYDLVVKRFMAVMGEDGTRESLRADIKVGKHVFYLRGRRIIKEGWIRYYRPYYKSEEIALPKVEEGQSIKFWGVELVDKFSSPPARFNPSSLLKLMEEEQIGTKATRADIIDTLYQRGYIRGDRAVTSDLGFTVIEVLENYVDHILSVEMTRQLEESVENIQFGKSSRQKVILDTLKSLKGDLEQLKTNEAAVGSELTKAVRRLYKEQRELGPCPSCGSGTMILVRSKKTGKRFVGCTNFREKKCFTSFPLVQRGKIEALHKPCPTCGYPMIKIYFGKRPMTTCVNWVKCPARKPKKKTSKNKKGDVTG